MFIHQTDGTRLAHAYRGEGWLGTNIGDLGIDVTGYAYGTEMLAIEQSGWVSYVFVNPADENQYQRKHSWIVTHDGLQFGSGWYDRSYDLRTEDPAAFTKAYVQNALDYYEANGREATIAHYQSSDSIDGEWYLFMIGEDGIRLVHPTVPDLVGQQIGDGGGVDVNGFDYGQRSSPSPTASGLATSSSTPRAARTSRSTPGWCVTTASSSPLAGTSASKPPDHPAEAFGDPNQRPPVPRTHP